MRNIFLAFIMLTTVFLGCKPRTQELTPQKTNINPDVIEQAKFYFENEQSISLSKPIDASIAERDDRVSLWAYAPFRTFQPIWSKTEQVTLLNGNKVLITPLRRNMKIRYANDLYYIRRLRVELNAQNEILKANIIELVTLAGSVAQNKNTIIANVFEEINTRIDAKIMVFDTGYTPLMQNRSSWKGEARNNNNHANNRGSSNGSDAPAPCYFLTAVASCSDVQYLADIPTSCDPGDPSGTIYGVGNIINNCPGGGSGGVWTPPSDPSNPPPGGSGGNGDTGQDQTFNPNTINYGSVNLDQNYKTATGQTEAVDTRMIEAFKFVIDNPTYRNLISAYLIPPFLAYNTLNIKFDINAGGGYFDKNTNSIYINPEKLKDLGMLDMVNILLHESLHAMFFKPNATIQSQLAAATATLSPRYPNLHENMVHHEAMGQNYKNDVISILRAFHNSSHGAVQNHTPINDNHFEAIFLYSLRQTRYPVSSATIINMWITQFEQRSPSTQIFFAVKGKEIRDIYIKNLIP